MHTLAYACRHPPPRARARFPAISSLLVYAYVPLHGVLLHEGGDVEADSRPFSRVELERDLDRLAQRLDLLEHVAESEAHRQLLRRQHVHVEGEEVRGDRLHLQIHEAPLETQPREALLRERWLGDLEVVGGGDGPADAEDALADRLVLEEGIGGGDAKGDEEGG